MTFELTRNLWFNLNKLLIFWLMIIIFMMNLLHLVCTLGLHFMLSCLKLFFEVHLCWWSFTFTNWPSCSLIIENNMIISCLFNIIEFKFKWILISFLTFKSYLKCLYFAIEHLSISWVSMIKIKGSLITCWLSKFYKEFIKRMILSNV